MMCVDRITVADAASSRISAAHVFVLLRVQTVAGLVENQQRRLTENGLGNADALPETATQGADRVEQSCAEFRRLDAAADGASRVRPRRPFREAA
jgi:hypothetical protein